MDARIQLRRALELDLQAAIVRNEFEIHYQPLVNLATGRIRGVRGLAALAPSDSWPGPACRVHSRRRGDRRDRYDRRVGVADRMRRGWEMANRHQTSGEPLADPVQERQSPRHGHSELDGSGLRPDRLELEITELVLLRDTADTLDTLHQLRAMGIAIALDDFGTGYSSLSYLRSFPFDKIKIDQSFVRDLVKNDNAIAIIRAVTGLGHNLNMITTAEGVETLEQLDKLRKEGCSEVQGSVFSPPRLASELPSLIEKLNGISQNATTSDATDR